MSAIELAKEIVGKEKEEAKKLIEENGFIHRIGKEDGIAYAGTCDFRFDRINLYIEKGIVIKSEVG